MICQREGFCILWKSESSIKRMADGGCMKHGVLRFAQDDRAWGHFGLRFVASAV